MKLKPSASILQDSHWMQLALQQAQQALGQTSPNPMVGAVLVQKQKILAQGFHQRAGLPHAEIEVLRQVPTPKNATLYVTLEPCCHTQKRTPPCVEAILQAKIPRVVVGTLDPNPQVSGQGISRLRKAGVQVDVGILEDECRELNRFYNHWMVKNEPYVIVKMASSLDGRIALASGKSKWITSESSRKKVHELRAEVDAILVGVGTILHDDPQLNARTPVPASKQPWRIILDPQLEIPLSARILKIEGEQKPCLIVTTSERFDSKKARALQKSGAEIVAIPEKKPGIFNLPKLCQFLGKRQTLSLLIEGGSHTWTGFLQQNRVQEIQCFLAPFFLGSEAKPLVQALGLNKIPKADKWKLAFFEQLEEDIRLSYRLREFFDSQF